MIKICGTTSIADAQLAAHAGANCLGIIVNYPPSPRHVELEAARAIAGAVEINVVAVSVNLELEDWQQIAEVLRPHALQLHGDETPELVRELSARGHRVWKAIAGAELERDAARFAEAGAAALIVDAREVAAGETIYGGTGKTADWNAARALVQNGYRVILAGGLTPGNVGRALETVRPWGVDAVSGVEARKGIKDAERVRAFVNGARSQLKESADR